MTDNVSEPDLGATVSSTGVHPKILVDHMLGMIKPYVALMRHFSRLEQAYGVTFADEWRSVDELIIKEMDFAENPNAKEVEKLDAEWSAWRDRTMRRLQDAALDLNFDNENRRMNDYINERSIARAHFYK